MTQSRLSKRAGGSGKAKDVYLLTGILFCGKCGDSYFGKHSNGYSKYICKSRANKMTCDNITVSKDAIEKYIVDNMYRIIDNEITEEFIQNINSLYKDSKADLKSDLRLTSSQLEGIKMKIKNLINAIANGLNSDEVKIEISNLEEQKHMLEVKLLTLKDIDNTEEITRDLVLKVIRNDINNIHSIPPEEQKVVIHKYINKILIFPDKIQIDFNISRKSLILDNGVDGESLDESTSSDIQNIKHTDGPASSPPKEYIVAPDEKPIKSTVKVDFFEPIIK